MKGAADGGKRRGSWWRCDRCSHRFSGEEEEEDSIEELREQQWDQNKKHAGPRVNENRETPRLKEHLWQHIKTLKNPFKLYMIWNHLFQKQQHKHPTDPQRTITKKTKKGGQTDRQTGREHYTRKQCAFSTSDHVNQQLVNIKEANKRNQQSTYCSCACMRA